MELSVVIRVTAVTFLLCLSGVALFAQSERGTISGTVTDASGAAVPEVKVTVTERSTNTSVTTVTNSAGDYTLPNLPTGQYNARFERAGFASAGINGIKLDAAATARADASLTVGSTKQTIEVTAAAAQLQALEAHDPNMIASANIGCLVHLATGTERPVRHWIELLDARLRTIDRPAALTAVSAQ